MIGVVIGFGQMSSILKDQDIDRVLSQLNDSYGFDFSGYARSSQRRRMQDFFDRHKGPDIEQVCGRIAVDLRYVEALIDALTVPTTNLFRDPSLFSAFRAKVVPHLFTYPKVKVWSAGCSTGEEVYSMAILLKEEGLMDKTVLYGTDINPRAIEQAKQGWLSCDTIVRDSGNYFASGGRGSFGEYWKVEGERGWFRIKTEGKVVFTEHNLATDAGIGEQQVINCRNVMIYFDAALRNRVLELFRDALVDRGFLCLGSKESLHGTSVERKFEVVDRDARIYRKIREGDLIDDAS